jgi:hypothetical protein
MRGLSHWSTALAVAAARASDINIRDPQYPATVPIPTNGTICLVVADSL